MTVGALAGARVNLSFDLFKAYKIKLALNLNLTRGKGLQQHKHFLNMFENGNRTVFSSRVSKVKTCVSVLPSFAPVSVCLQ